MYITELEKDGELNSALGAFYTTCNINSVPLGLQPADLLEIQNASTNFNTKLNALAASKAATKSATTDKNTQRHTSRGVVSKWAKKFRANPAISDALLNALMLPSHSTPGTKTPPSIPLDVFAVSDVNGNVRIGWNRSTNRQGTVFIVEFQSSPTGAWSILSSTTKAKFDTVATVGSYIAFRVTAERGGSYSAPSTPFFLWAGGSGELHIAA